MDKSDSLPRDAQSILERAARSMFDLFAHASEGMLLADRQARVVWVNDLYKRFLPALGFDRVEDFVGQPVSSVVQNTQLHHVLETGKPILIDLLTNRAGTFVVSRIPLRDTLGDVIDALGIVLFDHAETSLQPLVGGGGGQAASSPCGANGQSGAVVGGNRHRQGVAGAGRHAQ